MFPMILIKNGLVKTMAGEDIENGQVLLDGGKMCIRDRIR